MSYFLLQDIADKVHITICKIRIKILIFFYFFDEHIIFFDECIKIFDERIKIGDERTKIFDERIRIFDVNYVEGFAVQIIFGENAAPSWRKIIPLVIDDQ